MISLTLIGTRQALEIESLITNIGIKTVNAVNSGMFGNFGTLTYFIDCSDDGDMEIRKKLLNCIKETIPGAKCLCEYSNWNKIWVVFPRNKQLI